jgi:malonyl-CoA decarboxylase
LNFPGDLSPNGLAQARGLMVNYLYSIDKIEKNHEVFAESGQVVASAEI